MKRIRTILQHALRDEDNRLLMASSPIFFMHLLALGVFFTGFSWVAVVALAITYAVRVFALTAGFHRYFSHRSVHHGLGGYFVRAVRSYVVGS
jgi:stearoyl-CoA desaturase (delta-9 desaturase)